jgi:hypothetical protein
MSVNEIRATSGLDPVEGGDLPPKLYEVWLTKKAGLEPEPPPMMPGAQPGKKTTSPTGGAIAPSSPKNPAGKGSLPNRIAPVMAKAMSAERDSLGGTLVSAPGQGGSIPLKRAKRVLRGSKAKRALGCMVKAIVEAK